MKLPRNLPGNEYDPKKHQIPRTIASKPTLCRGDACVAPTESGYPHTTPQVLPIDH